MHAARRHLRGVGTDGGGATRLLWGEESPELTERLELRTLSPARRADLESSATLAESRQAPDVEAEEEGAGLVELEASRGRRAWRRDLAPRHRRAVREFFEGGAPVGGESDGGAASDDGEGDR